MAAINHIISCLFFTMGGLSLNTNPCIQLCSLVLATFIYSDPFVLNFKDIQ